MRHWRPSSSAQYRGGMVSHQDLWPQLGRLIRRFFATDVAAFASRQPDGSVHLLHCDAADLAVCEHWRCWRATA